MNTGAETDIITNQPKEMLAQQASKKNRAKEESLLKAKAQFIGLTGSQAGQELIKLVQEHLRRRIDELMDADPKAQTLISLLTDMGVREAAADKALARLATLKLRPNNNDQE